MAIPIRGFCFYCDVKVNVLVSVEGCMVQSGVAAAVLDIGTRTTAEAATKEYTAALGLNSQVAETQTGRLDRRGPRLTA